MRLPVFGRLDNSLPGPAHGGSQRAQFHGAVWSPVGAHTPTHEQADLKNKHCPHKVRFKLPAKYCAWTRLQIQCFTFSFSFTSLFSWCWHAVTYPCPTFYGDTHTNIFSHRLKKYKNTRASCTVWKQHNLSITLLLSVWSQWESFLHMVSLPGPDNKLWARNVSHH